MITAQTHLKESEPFIPYKALLIAISSVIYTLPLCLLYRHNERYYGKFTYGSSLVYAGFSHTNEHLCDRVVITITLTSALLSPRPG